MNEPEHGGMQRLAFKLERLQQVRNRLFGPTISGVTEQRMADMGHVHADLVRPSGFQAAFNQRRIFKRF